jgi:hypothetical protein
MKLQCFFLLVFNISFAQSSNTKDSFPYHKIRNILSIEPTDMITGNYALTFERKLTSHISIEIGGGITGKNFYYNYLNRNADSNVRHWNYVDSLSWKSDAITSGIKSTIDRRKYQLGYSIQLTPKYFFCNTSMQGKYVGLRMEFASYTSTAPVIGQDGVYDTTGLKTSAESLKKLNITAVFGDNLFIKHFSIGYYIGLGVTYINESTAGYYKVYNDFGGFDHYNGEIKREGLYPQALAGIKLGWGF